jgi:hypothetical protein
MEPMRLKARGNTHEHCTVVNKVVPCGGTG